MFSGFRRYRPIAALLVAVGVASAVQSVPSPTEGAAPSPAVLNNRQYAKSYGKSRWGSRMGSPTVTQRRAVRRKLEKEGRRNARRWK